MKNFDWRNVAVYTLVALGITLALAGFSFINPVERYTDKLIVNIEDAQDNNFIREVDVEEMLRELGAQQPEIMREDRMLLKRLEDQLESIDYVREAQVSRDLIGNLVVDISQENPLARVFSGNGGGYLTEDQRVVALSPRHTSRVLMLTGNGVDSLFSDGFFSTEYGKELFSFINHIDKDPFWKAQIAQLDLNEQLHIAAYTQIGDQRIEFGGAEDYLGKLDKLKIFYEEIVPNKGWNTYDRVKLQYEGQIVCD